MASVKPIVKWAGGKTRLIPELLARVPPSIRTYVEPFAGGAALFFKLAASRARVGGAARTKKSRVFERAILADTNEDLVACYRVVRDHVGDLIEALQPYRYDRDLYYEVRARDPRGMSDTERAARLLFLNRTCYNGLWRVNSKGHFNVPFGKYKDPLILDPDRLREASALLEGVEIVLGDFSTATRGLTARDFVYFDPPYVPVSKTADFTAYSADRFGAEEQARLRDRMLELKAKGVRALLSNADTAETRELYRPFRTDVVLARRNINRDATKRGDIAELLVMTYDPPRATAVPARDP
jgi:DNA adenine methylase